MKKLLKIIKYLLGALLVIYAAFCAMVYFAPKYFFYNPTLKASSLENAQVNGFKAKRLDYLSADGTPLYGWYIAPRNSRLPVVVFMHGNSYNIEKFYHKLLPLAEAGYGVFMPEYRGFGDVKGKIAQANLEADAIAGVEELHKLGYKNSQLVIYGMSLGSHMAVNTVYELQKQAKFAGLILEVPFDNLENVTRLVVPVPMPFKYIIKDKYHNEIIADIKAPILVMGGSEDPTVPVELAKNLFSLAPEPKKMIIYQGGAHSDLYNFRNYQAILSWLDNPVRK